MSQLYSIALVLDAQHPNLTQRDYPPFSPAGFFRPDHDPPHSFQTPLIDGPGLPSRAG